MKKTHEVSELSELADLDAVPDGVDHDDRAPAAEEVEPHLRSSGQDDLYLSLQTLRQAGK